MIQHVKCNIFDSGADVVLHQVNCQGAMGSGVALQVRKRFPRVYYAYKKACDAKAGARRDLLGIAQIIMADSNMFIANLFAQENFGYDGACYTDYDALRKCLETVKTNCVGKRIAIPYLMGCHRGGGDWSIVYHMIEEVFCDDSDDVIVCEYDGG